MTRRGPINDCDDSTEPCYFCKAPCTCDEFCNGCGEHVCVNCDEKMPMGSHEPEDHKSDPTRTDRD